MSRILPLLAALGALAPVALAAETPLTQEIHELRRDVQLQAKKIEALSEQILRLTQIVEAARAPGAPARPMATTEIVKPAPISAPAPAPAAEPDVPKAEAVPPPIKHTVEKGETLTSIAKHYSIPLSDLQKLNKTANDRKLQIGQTLLVPAGKTPETPAQKIENP